MADHTDQDLPADPVIPDASARAAIRRSVVAWFCKVRRPLPWREHYDPYGVWISEMMLQQTQVETVLPYYARWMERFPDLNAVAKAEEEDVLKAWEGLGYYRRARNLHRAARQIVETHKGSVPSGLDDLLALPGIGRYTAGAIRSIAHDLPAPLVDGNVGRVLGRLTAMEVSLRSAEGQRFLWALAEALVPRRHPRHFNEGLMELGALVCTPRSPDCRTCPLRRRCRAHALGAPEAYPPTEKRPVRPERHGALLLVRDSENRVLLRRRPPGGLWAGLWEPPWYEADSGEKNGTQVRNWMDNLGIRPVKKPQPVGSLHHGLTHMVWNMEGFAMTVERSSGKKPSLPDSTIDPASEAWLWADAVLYASLPMSRLGRKALALPGLQKEKTGD